MKKFKDLSRKSYLEAWNPSQFIKFVINNTSDGFFYMNFNQTFVIFEAKVITIFHLFDQSDDSITFEDDEQ